MAESLAWYLGATSHAFTGLLGATIPSSILWETVLPDYDPEGSNSLLQFLEASIAFVGHVLTSALIAGVLNPSIDGFTPDAIHLLIAPYFLSESLAKLRHWSRAIRDELSPW